VDRWYTGDHLNIYPHRSQLTASSLEEVLKGWRPSEAIIHPHTRVLALGSCFAANFIVWLADHGFNQSQPGSAYDTLLKFGSGFENLAVVAQQFRWAFEDFHPSESLWVTQDKQVIDPTDQDREAVRARLESTDVLILTLGLSEIWYDRTTGEPLWRAIPRRLFDHERFAFKVLSVAETLGYLEQIHRIRAAHLPNLRIVFTVSPIRLRATFRPVSAVVANSVSKAILRAALDEFLRSKQDELGTSYYYFPSYELVTDVFSHSFVEDNRHVYDAVIGETLELFARTYTSLTVAEYAQGGDWLLRNRIEEAQIGELERANVDLQRICDERQQVIDDLVRVAAERLELIERLHAECARYQSAL